ncbi:MAG: electron transfer flavoprotein subunit alpha/FixB family protein [Chloroflexota bacterium]|nr:MAG: electron transfer flavoprotein subunit alpha/FixB family protein [Chloroflexota bacterium]
MATAKEVWVVAEHLEGDLREITLEMLGEGRKLARKLGEPLCAVLIGHEAEGLTEPLAQYGADKVYLVQNPLLAQYTTDAYASALTDLLQKHTPSILMLAATPNGKDLAPRVAARLKVGLASDCIILKVDDQGILNMVRPTHGGKVYTSVACSAARPQIATIRPGVIGVDKPNKTRRAEVVPVEVTIAPESIRTRVVGFIKADPKAVDVTESDIVVSGGRGAGGTKGWHVIEELADALGGSVAGSRVAADLGCVSRERMVGVTGKNVAPRLYVAAGISGATQHTAGINDAKLILAINADRGASIFKLADMGVVADLHELLPALTKRLREASEKLAVGDKE